METNLLIRIKGGPTISTAPFQPRNQKLEGKIPIHWLYKFAYCEYQLYLEKVKGIKPPPTAELQKGEEVHDALYEEHQKGVELELTLREAMERSIRERECFKTRELFVKGRDLYGWIDEVVFTPYRILIIDDKPANFPYFANKLQVWGYCLAFKELQRPRLPLFGLLEQERTGEIVWIKEFLKEDEEIVAQSVSRILAILSGKEKAKLAENIRKCEHCRLRAFCKEKIATGV